MRTVTTVTLLMTILTFQIRTSLSVTPEETMRRTLQRVMTCPTVQEEDSESNLQTPVAAFSPARYIQLVAIARRESGEKSCNANRPATFRINDPRTWDFCAMGTCINEKCACFEKFIGEKCNKFYGKCWIVYCFLSGCKSDLPMLNCRCDPDLYGETVTSGIYFYDHGLAGTYKSPPRFIKTDRFEGPTLQQFPNYKVISSSHLLSTETSKEQREDALQFSNRPKRFFEELDQILNSKGQNMDRKFRKVTSHQQDHNSQMELHNSESEEVDSSKRDLGVTNQYSKHKQAAIPWNYDTVLPENNYFIKTERLSNFKVSPNRETRFSENENIEPSSRYGKNYIRNTDSVRDEDSIVNQDYDSNEDSIREKIRPPSSENLNQENLPLARLDYRKNDNEESVPNEDLILNEDYDYNADSIRKKINPSSGGNFNQENLTPDSSSNYRRNRNEYYVHNADSIRKQTKPVSTDYYQTNHQTNYGSNNLNPSHRTIFERSYPINQEDSNPVGGNSKPSDEYWNNPKNIQRPYPHTQEDFNSIGNTKTLDEYWNNPENIQKPYPRNQETFNVIANSKNSYEYPNPAEYIQSSHSNYRIKDSFPQSQRKGSGRFYFRNGKDLSRKPNRQTSNEYWNQVNLPPQLSNGVNEYPGIPPRRKGMANDLFGAKSDHQENPEFSTKKYMWSDTEDREEEEFKFVSGTQREMFKYSEILIFVEILIVTLIILK